MPSISSCPECHRILTIPDLADRQQSLGCPLCHAQFSAERVLAESENLPPAAIVLGATASAEQEGSPDENRAREEPTQQVNGSSSSAASEPPLDEDDDLESSIEEDEELDDFDDSDEWEDSEDAEDDEDFEESEPSPDYQSFQQQTATTRIARRTRQSTASPFGFLGQLLGIAVGGALGLAIGYWVLIWIGGADKDFLQLRGRVPGWLLPFRGHGVANKNASLSALDGQPVGETERSAGASLDQSDQAQEVTAGDSRELGGAPASDSRPGQSLPPEASPPGNKGLPPARFPGVVERLPPGPEPFPESYRGPRAFKSRTASELAAALEKADRALRCPHCQAPSTVRLASFTQPAGEVPVDGAASGRRCEYCRGKPPPNLTTAAFQQLCDLAEFVTFVRFEGDEARRDECREGAQALALALGTQRERAETAGRLAGERLDSSQRESNGIVLAGTVQQAEQEGELYAIRLMLQGSGKSVTVLSLHPPDPPLSQRDRVVVLGSIIDSPRDNLAGYAGRMPQVVWGGLPVKLASLAR
jgi:hypothetical protein